MYRLVSILDKLYSNPSYYLYCMTIYHIMIMVYLYMGIEGFHSQTLIPAQASDISYFQSLNAGILSGATVTLIFTTLLMCFEFFFLIILRFEFPALKLDGFKIIVIEVLIFITSFFFPQLRLLMVFLTFNTIQIMVFYRIATWIPGGTYMTNTIGYILVIKILWFPIGEYLKIAYGVST